MGNGLINAFHGNDLQPGQRLARCVGLGADHSREAQLQRLAQPFLAARRWAHLTGQAQLADLVGATRPSVNQVLQKIARQGLVEMTRGRILLLDVAELTRRGVRGLHLGIDPNNTGAAAFYERLGMTRLPAEPGGQIYGVRFDSD